MANIPQPESYEQILSTMLSAYAAKLGIDDFNVGSLVTGVFEVVALATARASGDIFQILRDFSVDRATGDALKRLAAENDVTPITAKPTTGPITVTDTSFAKISTKVYAGTNPPNIGTTTINVSDASLFPASGNIYIGRGTPNIEGPIPYSGVTPVGGYYALSLTSPTQKFHNINESVILSQGGVRSVPVNAIVLAPAVGANPDTQFQITQSAVILDGETQVSNVPVSALLPGASSNVPIGAIKQFVNPPFSGATVTNTDSFSTGTDNETDDQLRVRVKRAMASKGLGTATAVKAAVIGATPSDEQVTVVSDNIIIDANGDATLIVDDGTGYEEKSTGVGIESIVDSALGGERFFQLTTGGRQAPVAKAYMETNLASPFDIIGGDTLAIIVGGITYQHVFADSDFLSPGGATAFEITASINANTTLGFEASTAGNGSYIVVRAVSNDSDTIEIGIPTTSGRDAGILLGFSSNEVQTLRLYKNDIPLSKDGKSASLFTTNQQFWSNTIADGETLILAIDGTAAITYTINDSDFLETGLYPNVVNSNSLASWAQVFNNKLTGVTATVVNQQIELTSNLGVSSRAKIVIDQSSSLVTKGMFSLLELSATGKTSDYTLSRPTAQIELVDALVAGDKLSAGSSNTNANILSDIISGGSVSLAADGHVWILIDSAGRIIPTGVVGNSFLSVAKPSANTIRYGSTTANAFSSVLVGDYIIVWSPDLASTNRLEGRVAAVTSTTLDIVVTAAEYAAAVVDAGALFTEGFVILRSANVPQKFRVTAGVKTLDQIAAELQDQTASVDFSVKQQKYLVATSNTKNTSGSLLIVTSDDNGSLLSFVDGTSSASETSLTAFYDIQEKSADFPLFVHSVLSSDESADPIDGFVTSLQSATSLAGRDPNEMISFLNPYGMVDAQPAGESVQEASIAGSLIGIAEQNNIRRIRANIDRYYLASPLDFGSQDFITTIFDNDNVDKSFTIPFYRKAVTNTVVPSNPTNFNAYDVDSGNTANFSSAFGASFDFSNFKVMMKAKKVLKAQASQSAILYRSAKWGRTGEKIKVGYVYPSQPNLAIDNIIQIDSQIKILIGLQSGAQKTTSIDGTTEWNVSIFPNTPVSGTDQVIYAWSGTGTAPALTLSGGEYVNIGPQTELSAANQGIFRVSTQLGFLPSATSFTVQRKTGDAVIESNKASGAIGAINFYASVPVSASAMVTYVNTNLAQYMSATLTNDGGLTGSGILTFSTYEDSDFAYDSVQLRDGINWISSSNLGATPNFVLKNALALPSDTGYAFNNGEEVRLVPTTMDQVRRLISVLAVSGFTTVGASDLSERGSKLELYTSVLGSDGAVQVIGGSANQYQVPVLDTASRIDNSLMSVSADRISSQSIHSDQWFKLEALQTQSKLALFSSDTSFNIIPNTPAAGQSTIVANGRDLSQRYFGKPRHHVRPIGATYRVEKQGSLVCVSWNGVGSSPQFLKSSLNFNSSGGGTLVAYPVGGSNTVQYDIITGNAVFSELSIGDLATFSGLPVSANNGTFLVTGVSDDGRHVQVLNPDGANEFASATITLNTNIVNGDTFTVGVTTLTAGVDFVTGGTAAISAVNLAAVIGTLANVAASANGSVVTVTATIPTGYTIAISAVSVHVTVSSANLVGDSYSGSTFSASTQVSEGDNAIFAAPFNILNQGKFRVIRMSSNSIWIENPNVVEEEVTLSTNLISLGFSGSTTFDIDDTNNSQYLRWAGGGTEPNLENALMGDLVTFGTNFAVANRGTFMVVRSGKKLQEITNLPMPSGAAFVLSGAGKYFTINSAGNTNQYYVWFNVNGTNSDPAPGGLTGLQVNILSSDSSTQVATKTAAILNGATGLGATSSVAVVTVTTTGYVETTNAANFNVPAPFAVQMVQEGRRTFLECINPAAVSDSAVTISNVLVCNRPQIKFFDYDTTTPGDIFTVTGVSLNANNAGSYNVLQVIDRDTIVVDSTLVAVTNASINGNESSVFVEEQVVYTGYKKVLLIAADPGSTTRNIVVLDSNAQFEKANEAAGVQIVSLNKMNFSTVVKTGLDSYRYNTGLIAEANRIVYGDPRDEDTYPGVGAAGAVIFTKAPLARRVKVSIAIRLNTGVPFITSAQQVRSVVSSLVKSNDVGSPIAISAIVSAVNSVSGVRAVSISSPLYSTSNDLIFIAPAEKAIIVDPTLDISVTQIGS